MAHLDRKVSKIPVEKMKAIHETLYRPVQARKPLLAPAATWTDAAGKAVRFPLKPQAPATAVNEGQKKKGKKKAAEASPAGPSSTFTTQFTVDRTPGRAAVNIWLDSEQQGDTCGYLFVSLDGQRIFDDMSRQEKQSEERVTCVPLTAGQTARLTAGSHELKIEYVGGKIALRKLDLSLDEVIGE